MSSLLIRIFIAFSSVTVVDVNSVGNSTTFSLTGSEVSLWTSCFISGVCSNSVIAFAKESIIFKKSDVASSGFTSFFFEVGVEVGVFDSKKFSNSSSDKSSSKASSNNISSKLDSSSFEVS